MQGVLLKCIDESESEKVLKDMHEGVCGGKQHIQFLGLAFGGQKFSKILMNLLKNVMHARD